jgi:hypothetical protein
MAPCRQLRVSSGVTHNSEFARLAVIPRDDRFRNKEELVNIALVAWRVSSDSRGSGPIDFVHLKQGEHA